MSPSYIAKIGLNGRFLEVSTEWANLLGYTKKELESLTFKSITPKEDLEIDLRLVDLLLSGDRKTYKIKKRYKHKKGYFIWILLTVMLVRDKKNKPNYFISQIVPIEDQSRVWHD